MTQHVRMIPVDQITPNPNQPRKVFPPDDIASLARSIAKRGLIQPITVRPHGGPPYMIVYGECRWRAHRLLKRDTIRSIVKEIDDKEMRLQAIVENLQRNDMNPIDEANGYQDLLNDGYTLDEIVAELGIGADLVRNRLRLLDLTSEVQRLVASGNLVPSMASAVSLVSPDRQAELVREIGAGRLRTVDQVRHAAIALRDAEQQLDAFASAPVATRTDVAALGRLEAKIEAVAAMVAVGFKDGECVAAQRVSPDRLQIMADKLTLLRKHILQMEHALRRAAISVQIRTTTARKRRS
jgi:ParB family transcriptional regulator, chromosome partitioning protein